MNDMTNETIEEIKCCEDTFSAISEEVRTPEITKRYDDLRAKLSKDINDEHHVEHLMDAVQDIVLISGAEAARAGYTYGTQMKVVYETYDMEHTDSEGYPLVLRREEHLKSQEELDELLDLCKEGAMGPINWNTLRVTNGKEYKVDMVLIEGGEQ